ncbi:MAG TPA: acyl-CoA dehydrogenase family protein [Oligoflexia bacterium]|nr:acyl-CoA dehydrogenase family protein [Oligoflexia bacterium]HMR23960.1 acyl-CoA dehydrogenase family protein [Oligoflexia bacterium]
MPEIIEKENQTDLSFAKSLFLGRLLENMVFPYPENKEQETVNMICDAVERFAKDHIDSAKIEKEGTLKPEFLSQLAELGLFGLMIPEEYGGLGLSQMAYGKVFECIGGIDASIAVTLGAHASIGLKGLLLAGNEEQKQRFLPKLATGEMIAAFALTEPGAGSDAYSLKTRAEEQEDGSYKITGNKIWITNGAFASFFTVFAKTKSKETGKEKVTAFIVTKDMPGFSHGPEEKKLGIKASSTVELHFDQVHVPKENILGEIGHGFKLAMQILNSGRLGLAAGCIGGSKKLLELAATQANTRKQFGRTIGSFGMIKEKLGLMQSEIYALESATYLTCNLVDQGIEDYSIESAVCKIAGSEKLWHIANEATQIAGGSSYMQEYPYERMLRDARINMIFEGTNEILRCFIALSGIKETGEKLKLLQKSLLNKPIKSFGLLYDYVSNKLSRNLYGDSIRLADVKLKKETSLIESYVVALANTVEKVLQRHGNKIVEMQLVQKRLADITIDLYLMIACVSHCSTQIKQEDAQVENALKMTKIFCEQAHQRIKNNFKQMDNNLDESIKDLANVTQNLEIV